MCVHVWIHIMLMRVRVFVRMHMHIVCSVSLYVSVCVGESACVRAHTRMCVRVSVHLYACTCVYV